MNKVKCKNGHFFDQDRFAKCPFCGGEVAGRTIFGRSRKPVEPVQPSTLGEDEKTTLLDEGDATVMLRPPEPEEPAPGGITGGMVGGIKWRFGQVSQPEQPEPEAHTTESEPNSDDSQNDDYDEYDDATVMLPNEPDKRSPNAGSSLFQAVAATGGGAYSALPKTVSYYEQPEPEPQQPQQPQEPQQPQKSKLQAEPVTGWLVCVKGVYRGQSFPCRTGKNRIGRNPDCDIKLMEDISVSREPQAIIIFEPRARKFYLQSGEGNGLAYLNGELLFSHAQLNSHDQIQLGDGEYIFVPLCGENFAWEDYLN